MEFGKITFIIFKLSLPLHIFYGLQIANWFDLCYTRGRFWVYLAHCYTRNFLTLPYHLLSVAPHFLLQAH